jgi:hypothetical protein
MLKAFLLDRSVLSASASAVAGLIGLSAFPFPSHADLLQVVWLHAPTLHNAIRLTYIALWFTTPYIAAFSLLSLTFIFLPSLGTSVRRKSLPPYSAPERRSMLSLVLGEVHHPTRVERAEHPGWLQIPEKGLYTGILVVGAVGSGKTSGCMYPYVEQVLAYRASDPDRRIGGLILEVKGDFCESIRRMLGKHGRIEDYLEIGLQSRYRYNPLAGDDVDAYAFAFGINSVMVNLYGKGDDPFWAQAQVNLIKFLILLHQVVDGYVTLWDVYVCAINPDRVAAKLKAGAWRYGAAESVQVDASEYVKAPGLSELTWTIEPATGSLSTPRTADVDARLAALSVPHRIVPNTLADPAEERRRQQFAAVERWFHDDWSRIETKLRTSIVEGVSVFLSIFDSNPEVRYTFCPPRVCYDSVANADGRYGVPLPPWEHLIESGTVVALNFPTVTNPGLARAIATFAKMDFQRAVLKRVVAMARCPDRNWRPVLLAADECHAIVTCGEDNPIGDERFLSQSRQAKLIPILATQSLSSLRSVLPGESWRTLVQTLRTKVFLALSDDFSAKFASDLCGKVEQLRPQYSMSESGQDARVSVLTGLSTAHRSSVTASRGYHVHRDLVFEPKTFAELRNAQAIVLAYTGSDPLPPTRCYLKPWYLDPNVSYFDQVERGELE